ncbi:hypothetical protein GCM10023074_47560 [Microbispora amethystogenes]|uniref:Uncharacterized protein n=1 Tax=Microbispora amethystogenes TaxID=1427754 RepID=A0ABQ4FG42_9ACTN|nr:hypothetical protein Mam01_39210 [Microbispora amethystogenes]
MKKITIAFATVSAALALGAFATTPGYAATSSAPAATRSVALRPLSWALDRTYTYGPGGTYSTQAAAAAACWARAGWWAAQGINAQCVGPSGGQYEVIREI